MAAYKKGDVSAFAELVSRHEKKLWNFLRRFVSDATTAEDLLQEVFLRVVRNAKEWEPTAKFSTWVYTIARHLCTDEARREVFRKTSSLDQTPVPTRDESGLRPLEKIAGGSPNGERRAMDREIADRVDRAIATLPEEQREVFLMREVMDMSFADIAEATHISEPTVKSRMRYALERLRVALGELRDSGIRTTVEGST